MRSIRFAAAALAVVGAGGVAQAQETGSLATPSPAASDIELSVTVRNLEVGLFQPGGTDIRFSELPELDLNWKGQGWSANFALDGINTSGGTLLAGIDAVNLHNATLTRDFGTVFGSDNCSLSVEAGSRNFTSGQAFFHGFFASGMPTNLAEEYILDLSASDQLGAWGTVRCDGDGNRAFSVVAGASRSINDSLIGDADRDTSGLGFSNTPSPYAALVFEGPAMGGNVRAVVEGIVQQAGSSNETAQRSWDTYVSYTRPLQRDWNLNVTGTYGQIENRGGLRGNNGDLAAISAIVQGPLTERLDGHVAAAFNSTFDDQSIVSLEAGGRYRLFPNRNLFLHGSAGPDFYSHSNIPGQQNGTGWSGKIGLSYNF